MQSVGTEGPGARAGEASVGWGGEEAMGGGVWEVVDCSAREAWGGEGGAHEARCC